MNAVGASCHQASLGAHEGNFEATSGYLSAALHVSDFQAFSVVTPRCPQRRPRRSQRRSVPAPRMQRASQTRLKPIHRRRLLALQQIWPRPRDTSVRCVPSRFGGDGSVLFSPAQSWPIAQRRFTLLPPFWLRDRAASERGFCQTWTTRQTSSEHGGRR